MKHWPFDPPVRRWLAMAGGGLYLLGAALAQLFFLNGDGALDAQIGVGVGMLTLGALLIMFTRKAR